jgi:hypothetical protein
MSGHAEGAPRPWRGWCCLLLLLTAGLTAGEGKGGAGTARIDWCSTVIGARVGGAEITDADLPGRVVLLIQGGLGQDAAWNTFMVRTTREFVDAAPAGAVVPLFMVDDAKANLAAWSAAGGSPLVAFIERKHLHIPGFIWCGAPRFVLIDADGVVISDMIVDGRDLAGNSRYQSRGILMKPDDVRRTAEGGPGPMVPPGSWNVCRAEATALTAAAVTGTPLAPVLKSLRERSKGPDKAEAQRLLDGVRQHLARQLAVAERHRAAGDPLVQARVVKRLQTQLGNDELAKPLDALAKTLAGDKALQAELKAAEDLSLVLRTAAEIDWGVGDPDRARPGERITAVRNGLQTVIKRHPKSLAARRAEAQKVVWDAWVAKAIDPLPW